MFHRVTFIYQESAFNIGERMPISRKDFEAGLDERTRKVVNFLDAHSDRAFKSDEIAESLGMDLTELVALLNYLYLNAKAISRMVIAGSYYYACLRK